MDGRLSGIYWCVCAFVKVCVITDAHAYLYTYTRIRRTYLHERRVGLALAGAQRVVPKEPRAVLDALRPVALFYRCMNVWMRCDVGFWMDGHGFGPIYMYR